MSMVFALVLFGCADDGTACERLAARPEHYSSKALCQAGQEIALESDAARRSDYPTVVSRCVKTRTASAADRRRTRVSVRMD